MHRFWICVGLVACGSGSDAVARQAPIKPEPLSIACTEIGCGPAFELQFKKQTPWSKGSYRIDVAFDDAAPTTCNIRFPLNCDVEQDCEGPNAGDFHISESGCALPSKAHELGGVILNQGVTPAAVSVVLFKGRTQIAAKTVTLSYQQHFPNGPKCGPACMSAPSAELMLP